MRLNRNELPANPAPATHGAITVPGNSRATRALSRESIVPGQPPRNGEVPAQGAVADPRAIYSPSLYWYALSTAAVTLGLVGIGGLVTSHGVGMAVPDWPTSYGYNMFFFPVSKWIGGIFYEHSHRLVASVVGLLIVGLTRWLGGRPARLPLAIIGLTEVLLGVLLLRLGSQWQGAGHFLSGIGGIVLLAAAVWTRNRPAVWPLPLCGWLAFGLVQLQGLIGGLRVVLFKDELGIFHAALAQIFFTLTCLIALFTSRWWLTQARSGPGFPALPPAGSALSPTDSRRAKLAFVFLGIAFLVFCQLILGATMRHQHAGLAIPDFPLAYGRLWPAMDSASVASYNQHRLEITSLNPITPFQIALQMMHRFLALVVLVAVAWNAWNTRRLLGPRNLLSKLALCWLGLILVQVLLGALTIWSNKAADIATAHVMAGALLLATGPILWLIAGPDPFSGTELGFSSLRPEPGGGAGTSVSSID